MKTKLVLVLAALLMLGPALHAQTADEFVSQGRAFLSQSNLAAANNSFASAVALSPDNPSANVFYAATRFLILPSEPVGSNLLSRIGVPLAGRDIYNWTAELPADTNGVPLAPAGVNANEFTTVLRTNCLPAFIASDENLAKVIDTNFVMNLTSNETRTVSVTLDYGDVLMLRAMLHAAEYFTYTTYSWNLDAQLASIRALYANDEFTIERLMMDYPNLLTFATTNDLAAAQIAFQNGTDLYLQASEFIRNRPTNVTRLFNYDAGKAKAERKFRLTIADLTKSLNGAIPLVVDTNYTVFLPEHFSGTHPLRSFLPAFHGKGFVLGSIEDPTFGGLIHGFTEEAAEVLLADHLMAVPTIAPGSSATGEDFQFSISVAKGRGYIVQVSTNLLDWTDYAAFVSMGGQFGFADTNSSGFPYRYYRVEDRTGNMPPPTNDNFENRAMIPGMNIPVVSYTDGATRQTGEPYLGRGHTIWWTWTSPVSADVKVVVSGANAAVYIYTGTSLSSLTLVSSGYMNQPGFAAQAGVTYQIAVDMYNQDGAVQLVITQPPVLQVASPTNNAVFTAPANIAISGSALDPDGQIRQITVSASTNLDFQSTGSNFSFVWSNMPPANYNMQFTATDDAGAQVSVSRWIRVAPVNDDFTNASRIAGAPLTVNGSNSGASNESGEPNHAGNSWGTSVWWDWTPTSTGPVTIQCDVTDRWGNRVRPLLGVYTGNTISNLALVASNTPAYSLPSATAIASFMASVGQNYKIAVDCGGDITLRFIPTQPPLVNIVSLTNNSVFVGPANVTITVDASDPDGNVSRVDYYSGSTLIGSATASPYIMVWSNVDLGSYSMTAKATDNAGVFTFSPVFTIRVTPPNDDFANATPISGKSLTVSGSNVAANKEPGEPNHAGYSGGHSVWWYWMAPASGTVTISGGLTNSGYSVGYPLMGVYTGSSISNLTAVASNAAFNYGESAKVSFNATTGTTYQIALDDRNGYTGNFTLNVNLMQPPVVSIVSPINGSAITGPTNIAITANASDPDGSVIRVDFYSGSTWIGAVTNSSFNMVWSNVDLGTYSISVKATDNSGLAGYSATNGITVVIPPVSIPTGSFMMGDTFNEGNSNELPTHAVQVSGFYVEANLVTKALWDDVYNWATTHGYTFDNPGLAKASNHPVHTVNWYDVVKWCNARSERQGKVPTYYTSAGQTAVYRSGQVDIQNDWVKWNTGYRLPTEAEWEMAARGGASGHRFPWSNADTITHNQANYFSSSSYPYDVSSTRGYHPTYDNDPRPYTSPVGSFSANGYGLFDMAGNVWEWCWDWHGAYSSDLQTNPRGPTSGSVRVYRGGSWSSGAMNLRCAVRGMDVPGGHVNNLGFRCILPSGQ